jgi:hypothetical protein
MLPVLLAGAALAAIGAAQQIAAAAAPIIQCLNIAASLSWFVLAYPRRL